MTKQTAVVAKLEKAAATADAQLRDLGERLARQVDAFLSVEQVWLQNAVQIGAALLFMKQTLPRGEYFGWAEMYAGKLGPRRRIELAALAERFVASANVLPEEAMAIGPGSKKGEQLVMEFAGECETLGELLAREHIRKAKPRPAADKVLQAWLREHHPDLAGKRHEQLPKAVQEAYAAYLRVEEPTEADEVARREMQQQASREFWHEWIANTRKHGRTGHRRDAANWRYLDPQSLEAIVEECDALARQVRQWIASLKQQPAPAQGNNAGI